MAEFVTLPAANLHVVPDSLTDQEACFAEPLAAACRIAEQQVLLHYLPYQNGESLSCDIHEQQGVSHSRQFLKLQHSAYYPLDCSNFGSMVCSL
jgi:hypothetical protein